MADVKLEGPISGDPFAMLGGFDLGASGYVGEEWFVSGNADAYRLVGGSGTHAAGEQPDARSDDGRWSAAVDRNAAFLTRILVRRPSDPAHFNGTLAVEWMNVSGGIDAAPDWLFLHRHFMREGAAWVGVSVQKAGIDGGGLVPGMPLKQANAKRYGSLEHPGDAFAYDVFTQIGRALRGEGTGPFAGFDVQRVIAVGESQSAGFLVTYVNAIDPIVRCYDGFLIHGRPGAAAGVDGVYMRARKPDEIPSAADRLAGAHRIREDARVPVMNLQSETDVVGLGSWRARQPDSAHFRLYEVAGAAHFDTYGLIASHADDGSLGPADLAERLAPTDRPLGMQAGSPVNSGPQQHYVLNAAFAHLERQVRDGTPPPRAERLITVGDPVRDLARDDDGIARGGIRTPWVDAPSAVLSGIGQGGEGFSFLFGTTAPLSEAALAKRYPGGHEEHRMRFDAATDAALEAGFLLEADAEEIRALGEHGRQPSGWRER